MKVLVVVAHPDDEVLGAGGTIARHCDADDAVTVAILGTGLASRLEDQSQLDRDSLERLRDQSRTAVKSLGCSDLRFFDFPDNRFDGVDLLDIVKTVELVQDEVQAEWVYTHFIGDLNIDHQRCAQAVMTAMRPLPGSAVRRIMAMEVPSATGWNFAPSPGGSFVPNVFLDIKEVLEKKISAMAVYDAEQQPFPHPRAGESLRQRAQTWGHFVGLEAVEPFMLLRELR